MINKVIIPICFILISILTGCYQYSEPTFPTLDGTYILRSVTINRSNVYTSEMSDTTIFVGDFSYLNPAGPLDSMKVGKTRIHFSGNKMYTGYYLQNGGDHWRYEYNFNLQQDFVTQRWIAINVEYLTSTLNSLRRYIIIEDGIEYLMLEGPAEYEDPITGFKCNYQLELIRVGP